MYVTIKYVVRSSCRTRNGGRCWCRAARAPSARSPAGTQRGARAGSCRGRRRRTWSYRVAYLSKEEDRLGSDSLSSSASSSANWSSSQHQQLVEYLIKAGEYYCTCSEHHHRRCGCGVDPALDGRAGGDLRLGRRARREVRRQHQRRRRRQELNLDLNKHNELPFV